MKKNKIDLWNYFDRFLPPGMTTSRMIQAFLGGFAIVFLDYLFDIVKYINDVSAINRNIQRGFYEEYPFIDSNLPTIDEFVGMTVLLLLMLALVQLSFIINHYMYFHRHTKSIYVMKRLRSKAEIHRLCWTVPLIGFAVSLTLGMLLYGIFCLIYFGFAPEGHIPEQTIAFLWRYVP